jgi:malate synthase
MEDAATAEIARCQIWQWMKHGARTDEGETITKEFVGGLLKDHVKEIRVTLGDDAFNKRKYTLAIQLYERLLLSDRLEDFLTLVAYPHITTIAANGATKIKSNM